uniref:Uncharacterized protein n=1 Tax=Rhizophora mucronata TaxID=61149 RepID=A0A2P2MNT0_RHIMU
MVAYVKWVYWLFHYKHLIS